MKWSYRCWRICESNPCLSSRDCSRASREHCLIGFRNLWLQLLKKYFAIGSDWPRTELWYCPGPLFKYEHLYRIWPEVFYSICLQLCILGDSQWKRDIFRLTNSILQFFCDSQRRMRLHRRGRPKVKLRSKVVSFQRLKKSTLRSERCWLVQISQYDAFDTSWSPRFKNSALGWRLGACFLGSTFRSWRLPGWALRPQLRASWRTLWPCRLSRPLPAEATPPSTPHT